jgi:hypothetical protein
MEENNQKVYSLNFTINTNLLVEGEFDITQLEPMLDDIYDKTEELDEDLDIDITDRDMYIMTNRIEEVLPVIKGIMAETGFFDMAKLELFEVEQ